MSRRRRRARSGTPLLLVPPAAIAVAYLALPTIGLVVRAPWSRLGPIYASSAVLDALRVSLLSALAATAVSLVLGVPLAFVLARSHRPGIGAVRALVTMPLVLPPVAGGVALYLAFGRTGVIGRYLADDFGWRLPFTPVAVVMAQTFVAMPFLIVTVEGAFRTADRGLEEAAATLGAGRAAVFARVTLPLVLPSVAAGAVLCWARALGEFGATIIFAGSLVGSTQTMPTAVLYAFETSPEDAVALSLLLLLVALVVLGSLRERWLRSFPVPS